MMTEDLVPVNVLIVDDHKMIRDGLKTMLVSLKKWMQFTIFEAESGPEALLRLSRIAIDFIIIDYQMPEISGAETVQRILRFKPQMKILALSNYDELPYIQAMMDAGAHGYVLKNIEPSELLNAIKTIRSGNIYYCNDVAIKLIESGEEKSKKPNPTLDLLTRREIEILLLIAREFTNEEIASQLFIAKRTVDTHRQNLLNKLQVKNTAGLVKAAFKLKLIESLN